MYQEIFPKSLGGIDFPTESRNFHRFEDNLPNFRTYFRTIRKYIKKVRTFYKSPKLFLQCNLSGRNIMRYFNAFVKRIPEKKATLINYIDFPTTMCLREIIFLLDYL